MSEIRKLNGYDIKDKTARANHSALVEEVNNFVDGVNEVFTDLDERITAIEDGSGGSSYELPLASSTTRGGIKIGHTATTDTQLPVKLSNEQAYVEVTKASISAAVGDTPWTRKDVEQTCAEYVAGLATEGYVDSEIISFAQNASVIYVSETTYNGLIELGVYNNDVLHGEKLLYKRDPDSGDALSFEDVFATKEEVAGSGGSNDDFIYVDELPSENIIESGLYRLNAKTVFAGQVGSLTTDGTTIPTKVIVTSERPAIGEMYFDTVNFQLVTYLDLSDGNAYVYEPTAGWMPTTDLLSTVAGISVGYGGVISSASEATDIMSLYIIYDGNIYQHTDGSWGKLGQSTGGSYNDLTDKPYIPTENDIISAVEMALAPIDERVTELENGGGNGGGGGKLYAHSIRAVFRTTSIPITTTSGYFYVYSPKDVLSIEKTCVSLATFLASYNGLCFYVTSTGTKTVYIVHGTDVTGVINMVSLADNSTITFTSSSHTITTLSVTTTEL